MTGRAIVSLALVTAASMVAQGFGRFTYPVLLDAIDDDVLHSYTRAGLLGTVSLVAYLVGTAVVSLASTRLEPISLVRIGLVLSTVGIGLLAVAPGFAVVAVALALAGLGGAGVWVPAPGIAATAVGPERSGLAIGLVGSGIGLGIVVAGPLTNAVRAVTGDEGAWRPVYGVEAALAALILLGVFALVRLPRVAPSAERVPASAIKGVPGWGWLLAAFAVFGVSYSLYFYFLVAQLKEDGWSPSARSSVFALVGVASAIGGIVFGRLSDRFGRPRAIGVGFCLLAVAPVLTLSSQGVLVVVATLAFGLSVAGTPTAIGAVVADSLSGRAFGAAFGSLTLTFGLAQVAGPPFAGVMAERTGNFVIPFVIASAVALGGVVCAIGLGRSTRPAQPAAEPFLDSAVPPSPLETRP